MGPDVQRSSQRSLAKTHDPAWPAPPRRLGHLRLAWKNKAATTTSDLGAERAAMLHIHSRWVAVPKDWQLSPLHVVESLQADPNAHPWGGLWFSDRISPSPDATFLAWFSRGLDEKKHTVAIYDIFGPPDGNVSHAIGIASPHPIDSASLLGQIWDEVEKSGGHNPLRSVSIDLSMTAISHHTKCAITSTRRSTASSCIARQFNQPTNPAEVKEEEFQAIGLAMELASKVVMVHLFDDGQLYTANANPQEVGQIAREIIPLMRVQDVYIP